MAIFGSSAVTLPDAGQASRLSAALRASKAEHNSPIPILQVTSRSHAHDRGPQEHEVRQPPAQAVQRRRVARYQCGSAWARPMRATLLRGCLAEREPNARWRRQWAWSLPKPRVVGTWRRRTEQPAVSRPLRRQCLTVAGDSHLGRRRCCQASRVTEHRRRRWPRGPQMPPDHPHPRPRPRQHAENGKW